MENTEIKDTGNALMKQLTDRPLRHLALGAYLDGSGTNSDACRQPEEDTDADLNFDRYRHYIQILERGRFDSLFIYDNVIPILDPKTGELNSNLLAGIHLPC